jgi:hypothetical protein
MESPFSTREVHKLLKKLDPLKWLRDERALNQRDILRVISRKHSQDKQITLALHAAADLQKDLRIKTHPTMDKWSGVYLNSHKKDSQLPIVIDTGASISLTPNKSDFVSEITTSTTEEMKGISDSVKIEGLGWVEWQIRDVFGRVQLVRTQAYYVPVANIRLFSPQTYFMENNAGECHINHLCLTFITAQGNELQFPFHPNSNLPLMFTDPKISQGGMTSPQLFALSKTDVIDQTQQLLDEHNHNLSKTAKELLLWHYRLAHSGFTWIQSLMRIRKQEVGVPSDPPVIPTKTSNVASCAIPKCPACQLGKQHRRTPDNSSVQMKTEQEMAIRRKTMTPGECVSVDQFVATVPGRLPHTFGKEKGVDRYTGGTLFVDHASGLIYVQNQVSLKAGETLVGKHGFERFASWYTVKIAAYHADNHPFASEEFLADVEILDQRITFSGVGAHFQNGVAERNLQTITLWARTMMMHQLVHWPEAFDAALWPFAMNHAVHLWNSMPRERNGLAPYEIFTGVKLPSYSVLLQARVWGCPTYVLDPRLQDGHKLPKWTKRARLGVYVGSSSSHSETVGLILNMTTGSVSPQYHVVYDELFQTVYGTLDNTIFDSPTWISLLSLGGLEQSLDATDIHGDEVPHQEFYDDFVESNSEFDLNSNESDPDTAPTTASISSSSHVPEGDGDQNATFESEGDDADDKPVVPYQPRRSDRLVKPNPKYASTFCGRSPTLRGPQKPQYPAHVVSCYLAGGNPKTKVRNRDIDRASLHGLVWSPYQNSSMSLSCRRALAAITSSYDPIEETVEDWSPLALAAKANDADTPNWHEAMNGPNAEGYWEACEKELATLEDMNVWDVVNKESWMNVLPGTWAFKQKRFPSGEIRKLKARFCARGDRQIEHVDYFETFAPVVSWTTVRLLLMLSVQLDLANKQVDYTAAFIHADIDKPPNYNSMSPEQQRQSGVYVEMPRGFGVPGKVLRLNKSLYGLKQAPRNFFLFIKAELESIGFVQQVEVDACLFISPKVILLLFVDDNLLFARNMQDIDDVLKQLTDSKKIKLEVEDDVAGFLGVLINRKKGHIELTQTGLIDRVIEALGCEDLPGLATPADGVLGKDEDGDPANCTFNYPSVIGMLWYLYSNSRNDLGFALSQASRFSFCPKRSHELALIRIGQYLKHTRTRGQILKPFSTDKFVMDCYVDSDFMGLYGKELRTDPINVKSRTGFVITVNGCPLVWSSKLQEAIAMSTMMAEYYALSSAMREVLPLRALIQAVARGLGIPEETITTFQVTVWEDNEGALTLANLDPGQHTPRSKFYDVKVHWFRSHLRPNNVVVRRIPTRDQLADMFTKDLVREIFERLRQQLMGW